MSSSTLAAGITLGGVTIAGLGAASVYALEKKQPSVKSIMRDFIIGCVLVLLLLQLLPDSVSTVMSVFPSFSAMAGGAAALTGTAMPDMEIQVGVPGF